jgi:hypothetical protein
VQVRRFRCLQQPLFFVGGGPAAGAGNRSLATVTTGEQQRSVEDWSEEQQRSAEEWSEEQQRSAEEWREYEQGA